MATDFYDVLGVSKSADARTIRKAYRKLAASSHPDRHPGDKSVEARFKRVNRAYQVLNDPQKRALYDEFGAQGLMQGFDARGARAYERGPEMRSDGRGRQSGEATGFDPGELVGLGDGGGFGDAFGDLFGRARGGGAGPPRAATRGADLESELTIDFAAALKGAAVCLKLEGQSETVTVNIPAGATEGRRLRIRGRGAESPFGGANGDLVLTVHLTPHPRFTVQQGALHLDLPITVGEAYRGAKVSLPTPRGTVTLTVPAGTQSGQTVRLRGEGLPNARGPAGDLYVQFQIRIPTTDAQDVREAIDKLEALAEGDIRGDLRF